MDISREVRPRPKAFPFLDGLVKPLEGFSLFADEPVVFPHELIVPGAMGCKFQFLTAAAPL